MQSENSAPEFDRIEEAINALKEKMKLINYNNIQPPYFLHTLTKFRETHFSKFLKDIKIQGNENEKIRESLKTVHYIISNFDDQCFDIYSSQLIEPYTRKMFQDNYEFNAINFKEVNAHYNLQSQIQQTLSQAAEWLSQIQVTQDLLARVQLYFKIKTPNIVEKVKQEGLQSEKNTWTGSFLSGVKKLISFSLRKGSKMVQSTFFTAVAPAALMLSLAVIGGTATLPWKTTLNTHNLITAAAIVAVPFILDSMADTVQKSDYSVTLKRWAITFETLADSIRKFNDKLEQNIRDCTLSANANEFLIEKTNLQKVIFLLNKNIQSVTSFDENKFQQMRERTQAYFKQYHQIKEGQWTIVIPKQQKKIESTEQSPRLDTKKNQNEINNNSILKRQLKSIENPQKINMNSQGQNKINEIETAQMQYLKLQREEAQISKPKKIDSNNSQASTNGKVSQMEYLKLGRQAAEISKPKKIDSDPSQIGNNTKLSVVNKRDQEKQEDDEEYTKL